jgi:hypothetical protein
VLAGGGAPPSGPTGGGGGGGYPWWYPYTESFLYWLDSIPVGDKEWVTSSISYEMED